MAKQTKSKGNYVDGYVFIVPQKNVPAYRTMARKAGKIWRKYGALDYKECMGEDLSPKGTKALFPKMTKQKPGETVWFSYIVYKSRKHRDQVNAKVMKDPFMNDPKFKDKPMPFDMNRMAYSGFKVVVSE